MQPYAIQVFEAPWGFDPRNQLTVRGAFELLHRASKSGKGGSNGTGEHEPFFSYDPFNSVQSLGLAYCKYQKGGTPFRRIAYFACHGYKGALSAYADVSRTQLKGIVKRKSVFRGLYFGSCSFADYGTAKFLLSGNPLLQWVAGYQKPVPWVESAMCDTLFFQLLLTGRYWRKGARSGYHEIRSPRAAAEALYEIFPLAADMTFSVFTRTQKSGAIRSSLVTHIGRE